MDGEDGRKPTSTGGGRERREERGDGKEEKGIPASKVKASRIKEWAKGRS